MKREGSDALTSIHNEPVVSTAIGTGYSVSLLENGATMHATTVFFPHEHDKNEARSVVSSGIFYEQSERLDTSLLRDTMIHAHGAEAYQSRPSSVVFPRGVPVWQPEVPEESSSSVSSSLASGLYETQAVSGRNVYEAVATNQATTTIPKDATYSIPSVDFYTRQYPTDNGERTFDTMSWVEREQNQRMVSSDSSSDVQQIFKQQSGSTFAGLHIEPGVAYEWPLDEVSRQGEPSLDTAWGKYPQIDAERVFHTQPHGSLFTLNAENAEIETEGIPSATQPGDGLQDTPMPQETPSSQGQEQVIQLVTTVELDGQVLSEVLERYVSDQALRM